MKQNWKDTPIMGCDSVINGDQVVVRSFKWMVYIAFFLAIWFSWAIHIENKELRQRLVTEEGKGVIGAVNK